MTNTNKVIPSTFIRKRSFNPTETLMNLRTKGSLPFHTSLIFGDKALKLSIDDYHLFISYNFLDCYDIHITNNKHEVIEIIENIPAESLFNNIENNIQNYSQYQN